MLVLKPIERYFPPAAGSLLTEFQITLPDNTELLGRIYRNPLRATGRRIVVFQYGKPVFDSDYSFDLANARNTLDLWVTEIVMSIPKDQLQTVESTRLDAAPPTSDESPTPLELPKVTDQLIRDHFQDEGGEG